MTESKPCQMCKTLMIKYRVKRIYYSTSKGEIEMSTPENLSKISLSKGQTLLEDKRELIRLWYGLGIKASYKELIFKR